MRNNDYDGDDNQLPGPSRFGSSDSPFLYRRRTSKTSKLDETNYTWNKPVMGFSSKNELTTASVLVSLSKRKPSSSSFEPTRNTEVKLRKKTLKQRLGSSNGEQRREKPKYPEFQIPVKPPDLTFKEKSTKCLRRAPKLTLFYVTFYSVLALKFLCCILFFTKNFVSDVEPNVIFNDSYVKIKPNVIHIDPNKVPTVFEMYNYSSLPVCGPDEPTHSNQCRFDLTTLGPCSPDSYPENKNKCRLLKVNKIIKWVPTNVNKTDSNQEFVWVDCKKSQEHGFTYYPYPGFKKEYFPFLKAYSPTWLSPLIAIDVGTYDGAIACWIWDPYSYGSLIKPSVSLLALGALSVSIFY